MRLEGSAHYCDYAASTHRSDPPSFRGRNSHQRVIMSIIVHWGAREAHTLFPPHTVENSSAVLPGPHPRILYIRQSRDHGLANGI